MPRSVLLGRPMPQPGEPLFTDEDTAYALALAEEEADTCASCGLLKVVCRDPEYQFGFDVHVDTCWATHRVVTKREDFANAHDATRAAVQISPRYMPGREPAIDLGLDLADGEDAEDDAERGQSEEPPDSQVDAPD